MQYYAHHQKVEFGFWDMGRFWIVVNAMVVHLAARLDLDEGIHVAGKAVTTGSSANNTELQKQIHANSN